LKYRVFHRLADYLHYNVQLKCFVAQAYVYLYLDSVRAFLQSQRRPFSQMVKEQNSATNHNHDDLERAFELNRVWNENVAKQRLVLFGMCLGVVFKYIII